MHPLSICMISPFVARSRGAPSRTEPILGSPSRTVVILIRGLGRGLGRSVAMYRRPAISRPLSICIPSSCTHPGSEGSGGYEERSGKVCKVEPKWLRRYSSNRPDQLELRTGRRGGRAGRSGKNGRARQAGPAGRAEMAEGGHHDRSANAESGHHAATTIELRMLNRITPRSPR